MPQAHDTDRSGPQHGRYRVSVTKDYLVFASAHFITFTGHRCEPLHGHNYRVAVTLEGSLEPEVHYVVDFSEVKRIMRRLCDAIDHRVLLPATSEKMEITEGEDGMTTVRMQGRVRYLFPREDCALLPIPNTTVEMLARYLADRLREELGPAAATVTAIEMHVEENFGQGATYREEFATGGAER